MQTVEHTTNAAGRLTSAMCKDAVVFAPEFILVESPPNCVFLDMQDEFCSVLFELHDVLFDDRRDAVAARAHAGTVDRVATIYQRSEEHTSELQSRLHLVCRLLLEKK